MKQNVGKLTRDFGNTYKDERGRTILVDRLLKKGFIVEKDQQKKIGLYERRLLISLLIGVLAGYYLQWVTGAIIGLVIYGGFTLLYYFVFVGSLEEIEGFEMPEKEDQAHMFAKFGKKENKLRLWCAIALPILLVFNLASTIVNSEEVWTANNIVMIIFTICASAYSIYTVMISIKALELIKKEN